MTRVRAFFSFRSPYSWIALRRLNELDPLLHQQIELIPFWEGGARFQSELDERDIGMHYVHMSKAKHLYILHDIKEMTQRLGYSMRWPVDVDPDWNVPHLAWLAARQTGQHHVLYSALVEARWEHGLDICDTEVFVRVVDDAGLDGQALLDKADEAEIRQEALDALAAQWDEDVFGVPYFMFGRRRFWGADRLTAFLAAVRGVPASEAESLVPEPVLELVGSYDRDTPGGCG